MLPKINRLTKEKDFKTVFEKGEIIKNDFLIFKIFKNNLKESRFGFIVSKKISNKATVRNKVKRKLREAVLNGLKKFKTTECSTFAAGQEKESIDVVIIALSGIEKKEFSEIEKTALDFFKKIKRPKP